MIPRKALNPDNLLRPETLLPDELYRTTRDLIGAGNRILFDPHQNSLGESVLADAYDIVVGIIPFIGDALGNGSRTAIAQANNDKAAAFLHGTDLVIGAVPVFGDIGNILLPANTILFARDFAECHSKGGGMTDCAFPQDGLERILMDAMRNVGKGNYT